MADPGEHETPDGSRILLRPISRADKHLLAEAFEHLGPESRYRRFLGVHDKLTARELRYFTELDHVHHEAVVALDAETGMGAGIARYVVVGDDPQAAEVAFTVIDEWQGRGVGTILMAALVDRARANGIRRFVASVLSTNQAMIELLYGLGDVEVTGREGGTSEFSVTLPPT